MRADDITSRFIPMTSLSIVSCLRQLLESKSDTLLNNLFILTTLTNCILGKRIYCRFSRESFFEAFDDPSVRSSHKRF